MTGSCHGHFAFDNSKTYESQYRFDLHDGRDAVRLSHVRRQEFRPTRWDPTASSTTPASMPLPTGFIGLDPPDEITLRAPKIRNSTTRHGRPAQWKDPLPLLGEVSITGLTPDEAAAYVQQLASKYYIKPDIHMEVVAQSKFYYIFGIGANKTGKQAYNGRVTVVSALAEAGFNLTSWPEQVHISRPRRRPETPMQPWWSIYQGMDYGNLSQNYLLEEETLSICRLATPLAAWSIATSQLLAPILNTTALVTVGGQIVKPGSGGL